mgnify:CR=1 FL=1
MHYLEHHEEWLDYDGRKVVLNGVAHKIRVSTYRAIYPYEHVAITVHADPVDKRTKYYRDTKRELGDDWSTDVLGSDIELQVNILLQLQEN